MTQLSIKINKTIRPPYLSVHAPKLLLDDFAGSFTLADTVCVLPIYASREAHDDSISSYDLVEKTENAVNMESFDEVIKYIEKKTHNGDVILTLGAGDVYTLIDRLI
jgi:UDP-N-acetylmuramate--alanine ligase